MLCEGYLPLCFKVLHHPSQKKKKSGPATRAKPDFFFFFLNSSRFSAFIWCPYFQQLGFMQKNIKCHRAYNKRKIMRAPNTAVLQASVGCF